MAVPPSLAPIVAPPGFRSGRGYRTQRAGTWRNPTPVFNIAARRSDEGFLW